jgi:hypothetical protein
MAASLFRMEAVEFQRTRAWAGATTAPPVATWLLTTSSPHRSPARSCSSPVVVTPARKPFRDILLR